MVTRDIYIPSCHWEVHIYYAVTGYNEKVIIPDLKSIQCPRPILRRVQKNLVSGKMDSGFTYSNKLLHCTVMVVGMHSTPAQFLNSFEHELRHLIDDISDATSIPVRGEEVAYLTGDINALVAEDVKMFLCDCKKCKHKVSDEIQATSDERRATRD